MIDYFCPGAHAPLTSEGNIVVDRVLASCYASTDHNLVHIATKPLQWFPEMMKSILGEEDGFSTFCRTAEKLGTWFIPYEQAPYVFNINNHSN